MELRDALLKRRSIRKFEDKPIERELIEELLHAAMSGPSACNKQPWEFYVISGNALASLRDASRFMGYDAPLAIVVCGDLTRALPLKFSEYWIQDCSAATENILLRATDLGLGAVWCGAHPQTRVAEKIQDALGIGPKKIPLNIIFLGYPAEEQEPLDRYDPSRIHYVE